MIQVKKLYVSDLLSQPLVVDDVTLDAHVDCVIKHTERNGYEIDWINIREVYLVVPGKDPFLLDQDSFKSRHQNLFKRFENSVDLAALNKAKATPDHKWTFEECEESA